MTTPLPNTFPERLRALRERSGRSRSELAQLAHMGEDALAHIERGTTRAAPEQVVTLALALAISADALLGLAEVQDSEERADLRRILRYTKRLEPRHLNLVAQVAEALAAGGGGAGGKS
jgi:transcriptional regulator with XRE-family HTH domain